MNTGTTIRNIAVFAIVVIIAIGALIFFIRQLSHPAGSGASPSPTPVSRSSIDEVKLTVQGPIVANEQFVSEVLDITPTQRSLTASVTYGNNLVTSQTLDNNSDAFNQLLGALLDAGLIQSVHGRNIATSAGSTCPQGLRFTYETFDTGGTTLTSLWASTCSTANQSFAGNLQLTNQLVRAQFPNISRLPSQFPVLQRLAW